MSDPHWNIELIKQVASEMYKDGTSRCERYSQKTWELRGWPPLDSDIIVDAIDAYLKFLKSMDIYNGKEIPEYRTEFSVGIRRASNKFKKT